MVGIAPNVKVDIEVSGELDGARKPRDLSKVHPEVLNERRQQYFPALRHIRGTGPFRGKQKKMVGESGKKRCTAKRGGKTSGTMLSGIKQ